MNDQFIKFYDNIKITSAQRDDATTKYKGVCKKLHDYYYPNIEYNGNTKLLIGSYAKHTHIRPARDVDVIFILPPEKFDQYNDNQSNCQSQLLQDVKKILVEKYPNTPIKADEKVVTIQFAETKHDVELLPAWEYEDGTFKIANSKNSGHWDNWDPRSEIKKVNDSDLITKKTRILVRMIKKWSENCTAKIKSYIIEDKVINFFNINNDYEIEYSKLIKSFFKYFYDNTIEEGLRSHLLTAYNRAAKACELERDKKIDDATAEWRKIFGDDFPATAKADKQNVFNEKVQRLYSNYPAKNEEYLDVKYGIKTNLNPAYTLKIDADVEQRAYRNDLLSNFLLRKLPLLKEKKLIFKITKNTVPPPYDVKWKVRNFGDEAKNAADLRGEIYDDAGYEKRHENTRYMGEHFVECYVIKNGVCVAKAKVLVPIGNNY